MKDTYRTRELAEAAALLVNKQRLTEIKRLGKVCWFVFEDLETCTKISHEYFFGTLLVNALDFHETMTRLKNRIFAEK